MAGKRTRRTFTPEEKARIVLLAAKAGVPRSTWNEWKRRRGKGDKEWQAGGDGIHMSQRKALNSRPALTSSGT